MAKYKFQMPKDRRTTKLLVSLAFLLILGGTILGARYVYSNSLKPVSASEKSQLVTIPTGATVKEIASLLENAKVIREGWAFEWYVRNSDVRSQLQAGTYALRPSQSVKEIVSILTQGNIATDLVTILPGKRLDEVRDGLINAGFSPEAVDAALNPALYADHPALVDKPKDANLEGYIYPESHQKIAQTKPETVIRASLDEMHKYLTPELRAGIVRQGLTVHQGVILASIIEQEVSAPEDKSRAAQVFLRRLRESIALESDATTSYGAVLDGREPTPGYDSLYNTYQHPGLTPSPISNVSKSSLEAVANPANTDFLFFVAGHDCVTRFSHTVAEHDALKRAHGIGCKKQ